MKLTLSKPILFCIPLCCIALASCSGGSVGLSGGGGGAGLSLGTGFSANTQSAPGVMEYRDLLKATVQNNLRWNGGKTDRAAAFGFHISETGVVSEIDQRASSGNSDFDRAALTALENSSPLPRPPPDVL